MANLDQLFLKKYNELDALCREKYQMFRTDDGKRNNLSAIREYAFTLPEMYKDKLLNLIKLRNIIAHTDAAHASNQSVRDLESFIAMIKKNANPKNPDSFEVASYIEHNAKKLEFEIKDLEIEDEDIPFSSKKKIKDELYSFVNRLKNANDLQLAKRIVRDFYSYIDNIDDHPLLVEQEIIEAKEMGISDLTDAFNDVMDERKNPFVRSKAKEIFNRYKTLIYQATSEEEVERLVERGNEYLSDLL